MAYAVVVLGVEFSLRYTSLPPVSSKTTCLDGIACYQKLVAAIGPPKLKYKRLNIYFLVLYFVFGLLTSPANGIGSLK